MEPVSFTFGIIAFIRETVGIVEELKTRWQTTHENRKIIEGLFTTFSDLGSYLEEIEKKFDSKFDSKRRLFSQEDANEFRDDFEQIKEHCQTSVESLKKIEDHNVIKQTTKAISTNKKLTEMLATATQDKASARFWNAELGRVSRMEVIVSEGNATMISHINNIIAGSTSEIKSHIDNIPSTANRSPTDTFSATFRSPSNPPNIVLDFDDETTHEGRLKKILLQHTGRNFASAISSKICGVEGMGGVGKSCALRGLASCGDIREKYSGGVYFIVLGMDKKVEEIQAEIGQIVQLSGGTILCKEVNNASTVDFAVQLAVGWFQRSGKPCLFIVDDVWLANGISTDILLSLSLLTQCHDNSSFCFSTRFKELGELAGSPGMVYFETFEPLGECSRKVLLSHAGVEQGQITDTEKQSVNDVLNICGGLCVGLAVAGSSVKVLRTLNSSSQQNAWAMFLERYRKSSQILVKSRIPGGRRLIGYRTLWETIPVSLDIIRERLEEIGVDLPTGMTVEKMFHSFCLMKKQSPMSTVMLKRLWSFDGVTEMREVLFCFQQLSLLDITWQNIEVLPLNFIECIRLHDIIHDYIQIAVGEKEGKVHWQEETLWSFLNEYAKQVPVNDEIGTLCQEMIRERRFNFLFEFENNDVWKSVLRFQFDQKPFRNCFRIRRDTGPFGDYQILVRVQCANDYIEALELVMLQHVKEIITGKSKDEIERLITKCAEHFKIQEELRGRYRYYPLGNENPITLEHESEELVKVNERHVEVSYEDQTFLTGKWDLDIGEYIDKLETMRIRFLRHVLKKM